jgi:biotin-(acetyl-CoA carboxylase) ligase
LIENAYIATLHVLREIASNGLNQLIHLRLRYPNDISGDINLLAAEKLAGLVL